MKFNFSNPGIVRRLLIRDVIQSPFKVMDLFINFIESWIKPPKFSEVSTRAKTTLKVASILLNKT